MRWRRILKWTGRIFAAGALLAVVLFTLSWLFIDWDESGSEEFPGGVILRDANGEIMRVTLGPGDVDCRPFYVADEDDWIVKALVAVEDGEFWHHCGVRPLSAMRAFFQNVFYRRRISGASTLTMQAVRLIRPHAKSYWRKWVEAFEAMKMEKRRTKKWIISQYLNRAPFGANFIGIESAAQGWFGKGAKELGLGEAALLAGMVQAPSRFRPDRAAAAALHRRDHVLDRMLELGMIDAEQAAGARSVLPAERRIHRPFRHPYYCDWFLKAHGDVVGGDVVTPLVPDIQRLCENVANDASSGGGYSVAAVVMALRGTDGNAPAEERRNEHEIVALACSGDYFDKSGGQVNTALAPRPAGSTLKPFLVALAFELGIATPDLRMNDAPIAYKGYRPANFDSSYRGMVSVRDALILSLNVPFVQLLERVGLERFGAKLRDMGFANMAEPDAKFGLGMAIGNVEVSLVELVGAYARLAANASRRDAPAFLVSEILSGQERTSAALGHVADVRALPRFAWKTGTSSGYRDAWCVLWNPEYAIGVWCGHKRGGFGDKSLVGAIAAAPAAWRIARALYPQGDGPWFARPDEIATREICSASGLAASGFCAQTEQGDYIRGVSSLALCDACRKAAADEAAASQKLAISKPEDGAVFELVEGMPQQKIVCETIGNAPDAALWWFVDGALAGRTVGRERLVILPAAGEHAVTCADAAGNTATASFSVVDTAKR